MATPDLTSTLPAARPALLDLESPITNELIEPSNARGMAAGEALVALAAPGEKATRNEQGKDYRQKIRTFIAELARYTDEPLRVVDLASELVNWVLERHLDPHTGRPVRESTHNAYRRVLGSLLGWLYESERLTIGVRPGGRDFPEPESPPNLRRSRVPGFTPRGGGIR